MDLQKEREAFQECYKTSRDYKFYVRHEMSEKQIFEFKKGKYVVDCVNDGWKIWQAAKAKAAPKWISVKDNLPPANILVLGMSQTRSNIFNIYNVMALDEFEEVEVTHWMPLPDAPKADAEG